MQPALTCGILFLIHQLIKGNKGLLALNFESAEVFNKYDNEEEKYEDVPLEENVPLDESNNINDISQVCDSHIYSQNL